MGTATSPSSAEIQTPDITVHIDSLSNTERFGAINPDALMSTFHERFQQLTSDEQQICTEELHAVGERLKNLNGGAGIDSIIRENANRRTAEIFEENGIVLSSKAMNLEQKEDLHNIGKNIVIYLQELRNSVKKVSNKTSNLKKIIDAILTVGKEIDSEIKRLGLLEYSLAENDSIDLATTHLADYKESLDDKINSMGLIGFNTLSSLLNNIIGLEDMFEDAIRGEDILAE